DLERIAARLAARTASPRDMVALRRSLRALPALGAILRAPAEKSSLLDLLLGPLSPVTELQSLLDEALADSPPNSLKEGGLIRAGFNEQLDELNTLSRDSKQWIAQFRASEAERIGIPAMKI